jgi:hypothetical protein
MLLYLLHIDFYFFPLQFSLTPHRSFLLNLTTHAIYSFGIPLKNHPNLKNSRSNFNFRTQ